MGYKEYPLYRTVFHFRSDLICLNKCSDKTNPRYIEPVSVSLECSILPGSTVVSYFSKNFQRGSVTYLKRQHFMDS